MVCCQQGKYAIPSLARILLPQAYLQPLCQVPNRLWQCQRHDQIVSIGRAQHQAAGQGADGSEGLRRRANPCAVHKQPHPILAATVSKFSTRSPGTNSNVGTPALAPVYTSALPESTQNQRINVKCDPSTPDKSTKAAAI